MARMYFSLYFKTLRFHSHVPFSCDLVHSDQLEIMKSVPCVAYLVLLPDVVFTLRLSPQLLAYRLQRPIEDFLKLLQLDFCSN